MCFGLFRRHVCCVTAEVSIMAWSANTTRSSFGTTHTRICFTSPGQSGLIIKVLLNYYQDPNPSLSKYWFFFLKQYFGFCIISWHKYGAGCWNECTQLVAGMDLKVELVTEMTFLVHKMLCDGIAFKSLWPNDAIWRHRSGSTYSSGNGLLPEGTMPLYEPMSTSH